MSKLQEIIKGWSADPSDYYKELEAFLEQHKDAQARVIDDEVGCLVKVEYYFKPYWVWSDSQKLRAAIAQEIAKQKEDSKDED